MRVIPDKYSKEFQKTARLLRQPPWRMTRAADYLEAWLRGQLFADATAAGPGPPVWLQQRAHAAHCPLVLGPCQAAFARLPPRLLHIGAGAPKPVAKERAAPRGGGPGRASGRGRGRGRAPARRDDLQGLSDVSGISMLAGHESGTNDSTSGTP